MEYITFLIGLGFLLFGANCLVDSSVAIAKRAKISDFIIGLTIVGMGTSAPELFISLSSSLTGHGDMAVGNVVGSNICNTLLILGVTATILPFSIEKSTLRRDMPMSLVAALLLFALAFFDGEVSRWEGALLLLCFAGYMWLVVNEKSEQEEAVEPSKMGKLPIYALALIAMLSLGALVGGGTLFLDSAVTIARSWGVSESVISITIIAIGTSLPELITCVVSALKGNVQLALGNVLGSNLFNILLILGASATISPIALQGIGLIDFSMLIVAAVLTCLTAFTFGKYRFDRIEGIIFLAVYLGYTAYLLLK